MFEIMDVASRADLKSDLLKDLERQRTQFNGYRGNPAISEDAARRGHRPASMPRLRRPQPPGRQGRPLRSTANEWLMSIRSRISIPPGGTCEFDLPAYYAWQQREPAAPPHRPLHAGSAP